jgi:hypothetical protein
MYLLVLYYVLTYTYLEIKRHENITKGQEINPLKMLPSSDI